MRSPSNNIFQDLNSFDSSGSTSSGRQVSDVYSSSCLFIYSTYLSTISRKNYLDYHASP